MSKSRLPANDMIIASIICVKKQSVIQVSVLKCARMTRVVCSLCLFERILPSKLKRMKKARVSDRSKSFLCKLGVHKIEVAENSDKINKAMLIRELRLQYLFALRPNIV
jgi:hypothetical protein